MIRKVGKGTAEFVQALDHLKETTVARPIGTSVYILTDNRELFHEWQNLVGRKRVGFHGFTVHVCDGWPIICAMTVERANWQ